MQKKNNPCWRYIPTYFDYKCRSKLFFTFSISETCTYYISFVSIVTYICHHSNESSVCLVCDAFYWELTRVVYYGLFIKSYLTIALSSTCSLRSFDRNNHFLHNFINKDKRIGTFVLKMRCFSLTFHRSIPSKQPTKWSESWLFAR